MMRNDVDPPAAVRKDELSREARILLCKTIAATISTRKRLNLESTIALGEQLLQLKPTCQHGQWLPLLAEMGVHPRQAQRAMVFFQMRHLSHLEDASSEEEAIAALGLKDEEQQEIGEGESPPQRFMRPAVPLAPFYARNVISD
jgi:hypothetical protein